MVGGLIQLLYVGSKGNIFVNNPEISFFKKIYKSYLNFAIEYKSVNINNININNFNNLFNTRGFCEIPILGDLINKSYIKLDLNLNIKNNFNLELEKYTINFINFNNNILIFDKTIYDINIKNIFIENIYYNNKSYKIISKNDKNKTITLSESLINNGTNISYIGLKSDNNGILEEYYNNKIYLNLYDYKYTITKKNITNIKLLISSSSDAINENFTILDLLNTNNNIIYLKCDDLICELNIKKIEINITNLIKEISYEIDEYIIEKHNTEWLLIYDNLFNNNETKNIINNNIKFITSDLFNKNIILYIPLRFTFTYNLENSLPIASLYNSYNYIRLQTNNIDKSFSIISKIIDTNTSKINNFSLIINYIYLDPKHRTIFLNNKHELLIEQLQYQENKILSNELSKIKLNFTYLCKYIIWSLPYKYKLDYASIIFNNEYITNELEGEYYHLIQPLEYNLGNSQSFSRMSNNRNINGTYYIYSFSLYPNKIQPSGLCNMSRIDDKFIHLKSSHIIDSTINSDIYINIYVKNYNYLIINNGKGYLKYF